MSELRLKQYQERALNVLSEYFAACHATGSAETAFYQITAQYSARHEPSPYRKIDELHLAESPYVCLRIPTSGGKTLMATKAVASAIRDFKRADSSMVLWLVPSNAILEQTLKALRNPAHPYRQSLDSILHNVVIKNVEEALQLPVSDVDGHTCIIVATLQAFRRDNTDGLRVYKDLNGALAPFFENIPQVCLPEMEINAETGKPVRSLKNLIAMHRPVVIVDEAHNARTHLSFNVLDGFHPACIVEFTATPDRKANPSNVLYSVSARELQAEDMIKMPLEVVGRQAAWRELVQDAINQRNMLEEIARLERVDGENHEYIRPILLFQAMRKIKNDESSIHAEKLKEILIQDYRLPEDQVKIATGERNEIEGINLLAEDCPIRYIVTQQALREGWDCPFAYVLCTITDTFSSVQVEQFIGRIMRLPYVTPKVNPELNRAYVFAPSSFINIAGALTDALVSNGFEKYEAERMLHQRQPDLSDDLFGGETYSTEPITTTIQLTAEPAALPVFSAALESHVTYNPTNKTIVYTRSMSPANRDELRQIFPQDRARIDQAYVESNRLNPERISRIEMGYEMKLPILGVQTTPDLFFPFDEESLLEQINYDRGSLLQALLAMDYTSSAGEVTRGEVNVDNQGQITAQVFKVLQEQSYAWDFNAASQWNEANLVTWLDDRIPHMDLIASDVVAVFSKVITELIVTKNISLPQLVVDKYNLLKGLQDALKKYRLENRKQVFEQFLLPECETPLMVQPDYCFQFGEHYPVNQRYTGRFIFSKHLYPEIGDMNDEEIKCAQLLDASPKVDCWVRNLEKRELDSFWLQTSTDKFYPDFVCKLTDGRMLVVEYKGHHLYSTADSIEKRTIGETWAKLTNGQCLFVMTDGDDFSHITEILR